jgi:hypothetical protein
VKIRKYGPGVFECLRQRFNKSMEVGTSMFPVSALSKAFVPNCGQQRTKDPRLLGVKSCIDFCPEHLEPNRCQ